MLDGDRESVLLQMDKSRSAEYAWEQFGRGTICVIVHQGQRGAMSLPTNIYSMSTVPRQANEIERNAIEYNLMYPLQASKYSTTMTTITMTT